MQDLLLKILSRIAQPFRPVVRGMVVVGDVVIVELDAQATSVDSRPYPQNYCWILTMPGGSIVPVREYLDSALALRVLGGP
ncbi:hypothetical protein AB1460_15545 [Parafrankia sp. FMc2]